MQHQLTIKQLAIKIARELRKNQTEAENILWNELRGKKLNNFKFQRQFPKYYEYYEHQRFFIADFYCCEKHLVVEVDGGIHESQDDYDEIRSEIMKIQKDIRVIRFKNDQVLNNMYYVLDSLKKNLGENT